MAVRVEFKEADDGRDVHTYIDGVRAMLNRTDVATLMQLASAVPEDGRILEVGSYLGGSSILMASCCPASATFFAHDTWGHNPESGIPPPKVEDSYKEFLKNVMSRGLERRILGIRGPSSETVGIHADGSIALAFVDGDHSYDGARSDVALVWPKVAVGGALVMHDCIPGSECLRAARDLFGDVHSVPNSFGMIVIAKR